MSPEPVAYRGDDTLLFGIIFGVLALMPTHLLIGQYTVLAVASYTLFGPELAFYATP